MVMLINRRIGTLKLDAVISETHGASLRVTENPVESGANVADHAYVEPRTLLIRGVLVEHQDPLGGLSAWGGFGPRGGRDFIGGILPAVLKVRTQQAQSLAKRELKSWLEPLANERKARALAPWMLQSQLLGSFDSSPSQSRLQQAYQGLLDLQKSGETLQVQTGFYLYRNMLITAISAVQDNDGTLDVTLTLREVLIVDTRTINGVVTPAAGGERSGRAQVQAAPKQPRGRVVPKAEPKRDKSLLKSVLGVFS